MPALLPSELPVLAQVQHHWVVLLRRPHPVLLGALVVLLIAAAFDPNPMAWVFVLFCVAAAYVRWQAWRAEWVILTRRRIIRVRGIPETTTSEASLRVDRISGAVLEQTVLGKLLDYGTIEIEATGQHPDVRRLAMMARPRAFYLQLRSLIFDGEPGPEEYPTAPLPHLPPTPRLPAARLPSPRFPSARARHRRQS